MTTIIAPVGVRAALLPITAARIAVVVQILVAAALLTIVVEVVVILVAVAAVEIGNR